VIHPLPRVDRHEPLIALCLLIAALAAGLFAAFAR